MLEPAVFPSVDFYVEFLNSRGFRVEEKTAEVLHYFGTKTSEIPGLMKQYNAKLVIVHNTLDKSLDYTTPFHFVVDLIFDKSDLLTNKTLITNNPTACQLYYQRLGLNRTIVPITAPEPKVHKPLFSGLLSKIAEYMFWA